MTVRMAISAALVLMLVGCQATGLHEQARRDATERWSLTRAAVKARLASDELKASRFEAAAGALAEARDLDPENTEYQILQARVFLAQGKEADAEKLLTALPGDSALTPEALYLFGILAQQRLLWRDALQYYEAALDSRPDDVAYLSAVVQALLQLDEADRALAVLQRSEAAVGWTPAYFAALAECHERLGSWAQAAQAWRRAASARNDTETLERLALAQFRAGQCAAAIETIEQLRGDRGELTPPTALALAECLIEAGRLSDARREIEQILRRDARSAAALRLLARVHWAAGDARAALETIERAVLLDSDDVATLEMAATIALKADRSDLAERWARRLRVLTGGKENAIAERVLALVARSNGG